MRLDEEIWRTIEGFPDYAVSNYGRVMNIKRQTNMTASPNQKGTLTVGLSRRGYQHRKSVKHLVAETFVDGQTNTFNTVIQLDGDRSNFHASNLAWRPRWFAFKYMAQLEDVPDWAYTGPISDRVNGYTFESIVDAATATGVLMEDIKSSLRNGKAVFPTDGIFYYS